MRAAFIVALDGPFDVTLDSTIHSLDVLDTLMLEATQDLIQLSGTGRAILDRDRARRLGRGAQSLAENAQNDGRRKCLYI